MMLYINASDLIADLITWKCECADKRACLKEPAVLDKVIEKIKAQCVYAPERSVDELQEDMARARRDIDEIFAKVERLIGETRCTE